MTGKPTTHRELELKFRVHGLFRMPDLLAAGAVSAVEDLGQLTQEAVYHDTEDLRLAREGTTLRRRTGGSDEGWHLKLPLPDGGRDELRLELGAGEVGNPPAELASLVRVLARTLDLEPVATLRTQRHRFLLRDGDGAPVAELTDDLVSVVNSDDRVMARFRELEVEVIEAEDVAKYEREAGNAAHEREAGAVSNDRDAEPSVSGDSSDSGESTRGAHDDPSARNTPVGADATLEAVSRLLVAAGASGGEFVPKVVRALGPLASAPSEVPEPSEVRPRDPAAMAVAALLTRHTRHLRAADVSVRRDEDDSVHQMRVAARRLRSGLRVFRPLLDRQWADALRDELAWLANELGLYRDSEVLLARLNKHLDELPDTVDVARTRAHIEAKLTERLETARAQALQALDSQRYLALHDSLVRACADPRLTDEAQRPCAEVLPPLVVNAFKKLAKGSESLLRDEDELPGGAPDPEWHEVRILGKKARYAVEAVAPVFGEDAATLGKQLSRVTEVLGELQDAAVAAEAVHDLAHGSRLPNEVAFALGALSGVERTHRTAIRGDYAVVWPQVRRRRYRRWLTAS